MLSLVGKNALTVFLSESSHNDLNMFFCPYTQNNVAQYTGDVEIIYPGFDPLRNPQVILRPQRLSKNIHYIFSGAKNKTAKRTTFWIQFRTFEEEKFRNYYCYNCQAPQLYYNDGKAVRAKDKIELNAGDHFACTNCEKKFKYMGIVEVGLPDIL